MLSASSERSATYVAKETSDSNVVQLARKVGDEQCRTPKHSDRDLLPVELSAILGKSR